METKNNTILYVNFDLRRPAKVLPTSVADNLVKSPEIGDGDFILKDQRTGFYSYIEHDISDRDLYFNYMHVLNRLLVTQTDKFKYVAPIIRAGYIPLFCEPVDMKTKFSGNYFKERNLSKCSQLNLLNRKPLNFNMNKDAVSSSVYDIVVHRMNVNESIEALHSKNPFKLTIEDIWEALDLC